MTTTLRDTLNKIEEALLGPDGQELWAVLTALRGPDEHSDKLKDEVTAPIRGAAFPKLRMMATRDVSLFALSRASGLSPVSEDGRWYFRGFQIAPPENLRPPQGGSDHFNAHAKAAVTALGMTCTAFPERNVT